MLDGFHKFESNWGDYRVLRVKQVIHDFLFIQLGIGVLSKVLFQSTPPAVAARPEYLKAEVARRWTELFNRG